MKINYKVILLLVGLIVLVVTFNSCKKEKVEEPVPEYFEGKDGSNDFDVVFNGRWNKNSIKWFTYRYSNKISEAETREVFIKAFKRWSDVADIEFTEVFSQSEADITIGFIDDKDHWVTAVNSQCPLVMKSNTLAHAFPPNQIEKEDKKHEGDIHLMDKWPWTPYGTSGSNGQLSLLAVTIHEIGHSLGLSHTNNSDDIMWDKNQNFTNLSNNDIKRIVDLYGSKGNSQNSNINISGSCPDIKVGSSQNFIMTINNSGTKAFNVNSYDILNNTGAFSFVYSKPSFPMKIQPGGSYQVTLKFAPTYAGLHNSSFVVNSDAQSGNGTSSLTGNASGNSTNCDWYLTGGASGTTVSIYVNGSYNGTMQYSADQFNWQTNNTFYSQQAGIHTYYARTNECSPKSINIEVKGSSANIQSNPSLGSYTHCNNPNSSNNGWTTNYFKIRLSQINKSPDMLIFEIVPCGSSFTIYPGTKVKVQTYDAVQQIYTNGYESAIYSNYSYIDNNHYEVGSSNENFSFSGHRLIAGLITISDQYNNVIARYTTEFIDISW